MSAVVTEKWSGRTKSRSSQNSDTAQKIWTVVGSTSEDDAMDWVASTSLGYPGFQVGTLFGDGSFLYCSRVSARTITPSMHEVTGDFAIGNFVVSQNPLTLPWKYDWKTVTIEPPFDRDINGNAILNSTLDPHTGDTKRISYKSLRIISNESFYNYALYRDYENTVSSDSVRMLQPNGMSSTFPAGSMFCVSIEPAAVYTQKDQFVTMVKSFEIWDPQVLKLIDPFQLRFLDTSANGFYNGSGGTTTKGPLCDKTGLRLTTEIQLNGQGLPIDTSLQIILNGGATKPCIAGTGGPPPGSTIENPTGTSAYYLKYFRYTSAAFLPLLTEPRQP